MLHEVDGNKRLVHMTKKKNYHKGKCITCYIDEADFNTLHEYAAELGLNKSDLIRDAIHTYLMDNIPSDNPTAEVRRLCKAAFKSNKTHVKDVINEK